MSSEVSPSASGTLALPQANCPFDAAKHRAPQNRWLLWQHLFVHLDALNLRLGNMQKSSSDTFSVAHQSTSQVGGDLQDVYVYKDKQ